MKQNKSVHSAGHTVLFVAPQGNDQWSGKMPAPNREHTDGPFASITRARDEIRRIRAVGNVPRSRDNGKLPGPVTVRLRGGKYYIPETIAFTPDDSGSRDCPITYEAYPGETPVLSGGTKITGWQAYQRKIQSAQVPGVKEGELYFRSLFADGKRQTRARYPHVDPKNPYRSGFLYVTKTGEEYKRLSVMNIFHAGDELEYEIHAPADGQYDLWLLHSGNNKSFGFQDMGGRTSVRVDNKTPAPLTNLPDTEDVKSVRWSSCARLSLTKGLHSLTWRNDQGGAINLEALALCADAKWKPAIDPWPVSSAKGRLLVVRARDFKKSRAKELIIQPLQSQRYGKTEFPYRPGDVKPSWAKEPDAEVHIHQSVACRSYMQITQLKHVNEKSHTVQIGGKECVTPLATGDRFYVENIFEELDSPEEWYLNKKTGALYLWPQKKLSNKSEIIAPRLNRLFLFEGMDNDPIRFIRLSGLTMCETDYSPDGCIGWAEGNNGVVYLQSAEDCAVENCRFTNIGDYAVRLFGGRRNSIVSNDASHGGEGGILLTNSADNTISDNHIHHCGQVHKHVGGVVVNRPGSSGNVVTHNLIHDVSRWGIFLGQPGPRNIIEYNEVFNTCLETCDCGGINISQHDREFRSHGTIRYNLVHDNVGFSSDMGMDLYLGLGIYLDSFVGGYTVSHNITYRNSAVGIFVQGGKDNNVFNNIIIGSGYEQVGFANYDNNSTGLKFERNIVYCHGRGNLFMAGRISREILHSNKNLFFFAEGSEFNAFWWGRWFQGIWANVDLAAWQKAGFDKNSLVADPLFVNPAKDDYSLKPNSPAFDLGFEPIDVSKIGLIRKRCDCIRRPALPDYQTCEKRCAECKERRIGGVPCQQLQDAFRKEKV